MPIHASPAPASSATFDPISTALSVTRSVEDGTLESLMARASVSNDEAENVLDQSVHAKQAISPSLGFRDSRLELLYQLDYFAKYVKLMRRSIVIATALWILFVINDIIKNSEGLRRNIAATLSLRFGVAALALLALASTFSQRFGRRRLTWLIVTVIILFGAAQVVAGVIELDAIDPTYSVAIVLISSTSSAFFRLPCVPSIISNLSMYIIYVVVVAATGAYDTSKDFGTTCLWLFIGVLIFSLHAYDREWYIRSSYLAQRRLEYEEGKSQRVLLKMLPLSVIEQLRAGAEFMHERHSNISVLFTHLDSFDELTSSMSPSEVIGLLNVVFGKFDELTDLSNVYKVETIGDVYLVSAGVPEPRDDHANVLAHLAVSMMEALPEFQSVERMPVQLKIGLNSGPVIAGVVGMKYPRFRLMGDTVNTCSRMSSTCKAGDIQLTPSCFQQLKPDEFIIQYRGLIDVKGKGRMKTYLLKGRACPRPQTAVAAAAAAGDGPAERTFIGTPRTPYLALDTTLKPTTGSPSALAVAQTTPPRGSSSQPSPVVGSSRTLTEVHVSEGALDGWPATAAVQPIESATTMNNHCTTTAVTIVSGPEEERLLDLASKDKATIRIVHLPLHQSRSEVVSPVTASVASAIGAQLDNLSVVPGFDQDRSPPMTPLQRISNITPHTTEMTQIAYSEPLHIVPQKAQSQSRQSRSEVLLRAVSIEDAEPAPGTQVTPGGHLVPNDVIRLSTMAPKNDRSASRRLLSLPQDTNDGTSSMIAPMGSTKGILRITAKNVQVEGLFNAIEWDSLFDPNNPVSLQFKYHPELEEQFQAEFFRHHLQPNRRGLLSFIVAILLLGIYETLLNLPETTSESQTMWLTWVFRLVGLVVGVGCYAFTYTNTDLYERYQQPILTCVWGVMGVMVISILIALDSFADVYGVTCVLLLLTMTSTFIGLQFFWVTCVTIFFLIWYLGGVLIIYHSFPLVVFFLIASNVLAITASRSGEYYIRWDYIRHLKLQNEERRTRHFLDNMLPKSVIQEIKLDHTFIAHEFQKASVMFSDIVSFTSLASRISPEDVVAILNVMFSTFDALTTKHNVYKVETIGDAYLACSGVVHRSSTQVADLVKFALDLQTSSKFMHTPEGQPIVIRIGVHTGSVVAGVVGRKMPRYHLFGETVTIAEEMEQNGIPGQVVISHATAEECSAVFEMEELEPITLHAKPAKNILPSETAGGSAGTPSPPLPAATAVCDKTQVRRYKVIAGGYLGPAHGRGASLAVVPESPASTMSASDASPSTATSPLRTLPSRLSLQRRGSVLRPGSGKKDDGRAPPAFVANILGRVNYLNFTHAQERLERYQLSKRNNLSSPPQTTLAVVPG